MRGEGTIAQLPPNLLSAISSPSGGRVVLVLGAGCSREEPTSLPLAGDLSAECHRKLVADRVLNEGEVDNQRDLSAVAEAVVRKTGSQRDLIERFPPGDFKHAKPNDGYLIMAALLLEGSIANTLTLNFDLAAPTALATLGAGASVSTIRGPEGHTQIGARNLIYLHRDIDSPPDEVILRKEKLDEDWREHWEEVVAQRVLAGPTVVFVGLGSPISVLLETTKRIATSIGGSHDSVYVVDPSAPEDSGFASALGVAPDHYCRMGWNDFMRALADRVLEEHRADIQRDCEAIVRAPDIEAEDVTDLCLRLTEVGLPALGQLRAAWMLHSSPYLPHQQGASLHAFCNIVLAIRTVERVSGHQARFGEDGLVEFSQDGYVTRALVCFGGGWMTKARFEAELSKRREAMRRLGKPPSFGLIGGVEIGPDVATPSDITGDTNPQDVVTGPTTLQTISITELRSDPSVVQQVIR